MLNDKQYYILKSSAAYPIGMIYVQLLELERFMLLTNLLTLNNPKLTFRKNLLTDNLLQEPKRLTNENSNNK